MAKSDAVRVRVSSGCISPEVKRGVDQHVFKVAVLIGLGFASGICTFCVTLTLPIRGWRRQVLAAKLREWATAQLW